jgi:ubiquinone/menaquinone biosynthesis C-methylase UbiE
MRVAEIGAGSGYFTSRLARAVGKPGHVVAVDVDVRMFAVLTERLEHEGIRNVTPVFGRLDDPLLPPLGFDRMLFVNVFHHVPGPSRYLERLATRLARGGRIAIIDFHGGDLPVGPPPERRLPRDVLLPLVQRSGLRIADEHAFLPYQYFLLLAR